MEAPVWQLPLCFRRRYILLVSKLPSWLADKLHMINSRMQCKVIRVQWMGVGVVIIKQLQYRGKEAYLQTY